MGPYLYFREVVLGQHEGWDEVRERLPWEDQLQPGGRQSTRRSGTKPTHKGEIHSRTYRPSPMIAGEDKGEAKDHRRKCGFAK